MLNMRNTRAMNKKSYERIHGKLREEVTELEQTVKDTIDDIWADPNIREYYLKLLDLDLSDRRLWLVYSILDHSIIKTAAYFHCDRKTVSNAINKIKIQLT